jgi:hypothetical protein
VSGDESVFVRGRRLGLATALTLRIVHVHPDAAAGVDHLYAVDVAAVEGDALGAEDLSTGAAFDATHGIGQRAMILASVVAIVHATGPFGAIACIPRATGTLVEQATEALRTRSARRRH